MSIELDVLRAFLRLARRRSQPSIEDLVVRVGGDETAVRDAVKLLLKQGLLQRNSHGVGLTMAGLAVGVAVAKRPAPPRSPVETVAAPPAPAAPASGPRLAAGARTERRQVRRAA